MTQWIDWAYITAAFLFALGLKLLSSPATARRGNLVSALGMAIAVAATLCNQTLVDFRWLASGMALGAIVGIVAARWVAMTAMPEMVALFNGFGGIASLLVGAAEYFSHPVAGRLRGVTILLAVLIGGLTFSGSIVAFAKLRDTKLGSFRLGDPWLFSGQQLLTGLLMVAVLVGGGMFFLVPDSQTEILVGLIGLAFLIGVTGIMPIGGADMPVVISLLNSYSGLAACAAGFAIQNNVLIVAGSLVGASGIILTRIMCKAMNRSLSNVLFSGFGSVKQTQTMIQQGEIRPISSADAYYILEAANSVVFVPGYGLAVAQAQHVVKELGELLEANGCEVRYAIHPVAGRMPGHMNVLLAEAAVPYDQLVEMEDINPAMASVDLCLVIGANDVVNPAANEEEKSPIYGMPIIEAEKARNVIVLKRSMATGFAGIQNALFFRGNTRMLFGDAKASLQGLTSEFKRF